MNTNVPTFPELSTPPDGSAAERLFRAHIFCDFDGTISHADIGWELFQRFGTQQPHHTMLVEGALPIGEYWKRVAASLRAPFTMEMLDSFLETVAVDPDIHPLLLIAKQQEIPFTIVSDGFDLYIQRFLERHGIGGVELFCNRAELTPDGRMNVRFPHATEGCSCPSAVCKRNVLLGLAHPDARIIYIGDGISDCCPAEHADIIFAKGKLAAFCNANRLPHYPFRNLAEVVAQIAKLLARRRLRPRHQAALKRKSAWEGE